MPQPGEPHFNVKRVRQAAANIFQRITLSSISRHRRLLAAALLFASSANSFSTTVIPPSFEQLVNRAELIFVGSALSSEARWERSSNGPYIVTAVTFRVEDVWKGMIGPTTVLDFVGGTIGDLTMEVSDLPVFKRGDHDVLFVAASRHRISPLVGLMHGRLRLEYDPISQSDRVRMFDGWPLADVNDFTRKLAPQAVRVPMPLKDLAASVRALLK